MTTELTTVMTFLSLLILLTGFPIAFCTRRFERLARVTSIMTARGNLNRMMALRLLATLGFAALLCGASPALAATAPSLGAASSFAVLGGATVTNTGITTINGDMGVWPGTITGSSPTVNGTIHAADVTAQNAQTDVTAAYDALVAQACTSGPLGATDLAGQTLVPGVYCYSSTLANTGLLQLDAGGNPNAVWVFKIGSTLTTVSGSSVIVINGGQKSNVFWQVTSSATLGTTTTFAGNILALTSITIENGATLSGRALARNGTVTLDTNTVSLSPIITIVKSVAAYSDPVNGTTSPKAIPGSEMSYTITVTNSGYGVADNNTTVVTDPIPANTELFVGNINGAGSGPVLFTNGVPASGLSYSFASLSSGTDNISFSNNSGSTYTYTPVADANQCDTTVTHLKISLGGIFSASNGTNHPSFSVKFRVRVK